MLSPIQMSAPPLYICPTPQDANYPLLLRGSVAKEETASVVFVCMCNHIGVSQCHPSYAEHVWSLGVYVG